MFLRDYLYVDLDKVRGIISQVLDGVPELSTRVERREKDQELKNRYIGGFGKKSADEESSENSMSDSLFRILEDELEPLGLLNDISKALLASPNWVDLGDAIRPGAILRITAPGILFHPGHLSNALVGIATAAHGLSSWIEDTPQRSETGPGGGRRKPSQHRGNTLPRQDPHSNPEDLLPTNSTIPILDIPREQLSGMIAFIRGIYDDGVHLNLRPLGASGPVVSARLESGRRYLDASPEILFSRYGSSEQEWTVVGLVGQLGKRQSTEKPPEIVDEDGSMNRSRTMDLVDWFLSLAGVAGLIDQPLSPGFSLVPLAVYRSIGFSNEAPDEDSP